MEHFEVHKEQLEDLIVDLAKEGPKVFMNLPEKPIDTIVTLNDFAIIDEISGLNTFLDKILRNSELPETSKDRIKLRMFRYNSEKPKEVALNEMREVLFGNGR